MKIRFSLKTAKIKKGTDMPTCMYTVQPNFKLYGLVNRETETESLPEHLHFICLEPNKNIKCFNGTCEFIIVRNYVKCTLLSAYGTNSIQHRVCRDTVIVEKWSNYE